MRCIGISCVRNEADIVELWARHNLNLVDALHVVDHLSIDRTSWVLERLREEGLPLHLHRVTDPAHRQEQVLTRLARTLVREGQADFLVPLDADELLAVPGREAFHRALATIPDRGGGAMYWQTFLPEPVASADATDSGTEPFFRRMRRYRRHEVRGMAKLVLRAEACLDYAWTPGQHAALDAAGAPVPAIVLPFRLAHYPVREAGQLARKALTGFLARALKSERRPGEGQHWERLVRELRDVGWRPEKLDLELLALTYSFPDAPEAQDILDEPRLPEFPGVVRRYPAPPLPWRAALADAQRYFDAAQSSREGTGTG